MPRHLIIVPTDLERRELAPLLGGDGATVALCGFGIVAAAARTAQLVARERPERVILAGIAGRYDDDPAGDDEPGAAPVAGPAVGAAACFDAVACHGIGVGTGDRFTAAAALGWPQWPGDPPDPTAAIGDRITCRLPRSADVPRAGVLLTVAASSADADDARLRRMLFPAAVAEDMEGFAVALACRLAGVPCTIVRGISNVAGDRDKTRWQTTAALAAAAGLVRRLLAEDR